MPAVARGREAVAERSEPTVPDIQALLDARFRRPTEFGLDLVNPGWSVLLVLFRAHLDGRAVRMARLAADAHVAMTTMTRWIELFIARGLAERRTDPTHARGVLLARTAYGADRVRRQLKAEMR